MKKRKFYQILSGLLCCMFLLFAGCSAGGGSGSGSGDQIDVLEGTKVLTRPADYSFAEAVGDCSEYYYNLYAANILNYLYNVYERFDSKEVNINIYSQLEGDNTFGKITNNDIYYLYDSLRYTITSVVTDSDNGTQTVTIDTSKSWNWKIDNDAKDSKLYFDIIVDNDAVKKDDDSYIFDSDWISTFENKLGDEEDYPYPNFLDSYVGNKENKSDEIVDYYHSPYYDINVAEEASTTAKNYFQDALEYAIYMFVLGYDYSTYDEKGEVIEGEKNETQAAYFDFDIKYGNDGYVSQIYVGGWSSGIDTPIATALANAKASYEEIGGYVGIVDKNLDQIKRFILDKVIGENSSETFTVKGVNLTFNRNYDAIVNNIVNYACEQAPIGSITVNGEKQYISLSEGFSASMITEYKSNYFFANYDVVSDGVQVNDDSEIFANIEAAEYQSIVIYPSDDLIGKYLGDLWLDFEYYDNSVDKIMLDSLTINVGFRYYSYDKSTGKGEILYDKSAQMVIPYGKNGTLRDVNGEDISDQTIFIISDSDGGPNNLQIEANTLAFRKFNNEIGGGVLDPFANSTELDGQIKASKYLSGSDNSRNYYKLNNSENGGQYGTLNEKMFEGANGCSFMEIYFDIDKDAKLTGINYNFKVCFRTVSEHKDANSADEDDEGDIDEDDL